MELKIFSGRIMASSIFLGVLFMMVYNHRAEAIQYLQARIVGENIPVQARDTGELVAPGLPLRLKIPKININAEVEYVNLAPHGEMGSPKNTSNVGWYEPGVRPGRIGNAVIAGHYGWSDDNPSAFDELHKLRTGDAIYIEDDAGAVISFIVRKNKEFGPGDDTLDIFNATDAGSHLNLIACAGEWDEISQSYSKRLVVFADRE